LLHTFTGCCAAATGVTPYKRHHATGITQTERASGTPHHTAARHHAAATSTGASRHTAGMLVAAFSLLPSSVRRHHLVRRAPLSTNKHWSCHTSRITFLFLAYIATNATSHHMDTRAVVQGRTSGTTGAARKTRRAWHSGLVRARWPTHAGILGQDGGTPADLFTPVCHPAGFPPGMGTTFCPCQHL